MHQIVRSLWWLAATLVGVSLLSSTTHAQVVPFNATYHVQVSDYYGQLRQSGYVPLRVTINRIGPAANPAETLYVGCASRIYRRSGQQQREATTRVDLAAGQTTVTLDLNMPFQSDYNSHNLVVSRDASISTFPRRDLIAVVQLPDWMGVRYWNSNSETEGLTVGLYSSKPTIDLGWHLSSFKLSDDDVKPGSEIQPEVKALPNEPTPKFSSLVELMKNDIQRQARTGGLPSPANPDYRAAMEHKYIVSGDLMAIPETWLGMSRMDLALISVADLKVLADRHPKRVEALRGWVVSGGRLVVFDCGDDFRGLPSIVPNLTAAAGQNLGPSQEWWLPSPEVHESLKSGYFRTSERYASEIETNNQQPYYNYSYNQSNKVVPNPIRGWLLEQNALKDAQRVVGTGYNAAQQAAAAPSNLVISPCGTGHIIAVAGDVTGFGRNEWAQILVAAAGTGQAFSYDGIGEYNHKWEGYPNLQIANVGKPPWVAFLILITLFALLVGPLAFTFLKRMGRTHLLLAIVPAFALLVTSGIVMYAILQDGLGFRTARLSVTWLDSQNQTAFVQTNQAIYAGLAPGRFELSEQTPYFDNSAQIDYAVNRLKLLFTEGKQIVSGGRIMARTKHQVINFDVKATPANILVEGQGTEKLLVTNHLGFPVQHLILRTETGVMMASNIAAGAQVELTSNLGEFDQWRKDARSAGLQGKSLPDVVLVYSAGHWPRDIGRMSRVFSMVSSEGGQRLRPGQFIAISDQQPLAQSLHPNPQQEEELHLTVGNYLGFVPAANVTIERAESAD